MDFISPYFIRINDFSFVASATKECFEEMKHIFSAFKKDSISIEKNIIKLPKQKDLYMGFSTITPEYFKIINFPAIKIEYAWYTDKKNHTYVYFDNGVQYLFLEKSKNKFEVHRFKNMNITFSLSFDIYFEEQKKFILAYYLCIEKL
jgi:Tol biopolymer transport system component